MENQIGGENMYNVVDKVVKKTTKGKKKLNLKSDKAALNKVINKSC